MANYIWLEVVSRSFYFSVDSMAIDFAKWKINFEIALFAI